MQKPQVQELNNADTQKENILVRQAREGNRHAFTQLVALYQERIYKLAYGFFQDGDDAMEIVQETFMRVYEKTAHLAADTTANSFKNWVYRIAYNLCIDYYRKFKKKRVSDKELYDFNENLDKQTHFPEDQIDRFHFKHTLKKSVMELPRRQKKIFMLKHYSGLKHQEISDVLGISVGTVKSLYHRAMKKLEKRLLAAG